MTSHEPSGFEALVNALVEVEDCPSFRALHAAQPDLFGETTVKELRGVVVVPGLGEAMTPFLRLVEQAQEDLGLAWREFRGAMKKREDEERLLAQRALLAQELINDGRFEEAIRIAEPALGSADEHGHWVFRADLHAILATAYRSRTGDVRLDLDKAIEHMERGAAETTDPYLRAERELNLAALYGTRRNGDPNQNLETAHVILREARSRIDEGAPTYVRVLVLSNLARTLQTREEGNRLENLRESQNILDEAAGLTSAAEDPERWALVKINVAETTRLLRAEGEFGGVDAEQTLQEVADAEGLKGIDSFRGVANHGLGETRRRRAQQIAEESGRIGLGGGEPKPPGDEESLELRAAEHHLKLALDLIDPRIHGWQLGSSLDQLGQVYWLVGDPDKEIEALRRAIEVQTALAAPGLLMQSGFGLGRRLAQRGEWAGAAEAFVTAYAAGKRTFNARLENVGRKGELRRAGNVARWAAFALAKTGAIEDAIVVLENGRTKDVRRRLGGAVDEATLADLPKEERDAYLNAFTKLSSSPKSEFGDRAAHELQEVIVRIRGLDGFESFAMDVTFPQIVEAVEPGWPLAYVNPTPWGTVILAVHQDGGGVKTEARFLDEVSGEEMILDLSVPGRRSLTPKFSYLALAAGGEASPEEEETAVDDALALLSPIAESLWDYLRNLAVEGVTLVSSGPVGLSPLHAAPWIEDGGSACLLDHLQVRLAASATLQAFCSDRVRTRTVQQPSLLALGNPDLKDPRLDLPGAGLEVHKIAEWFPSEDRKVALREDATPEFLLRHLPGATHLHLACHASGGLFDYEEAQLHLADGSLRGDEMETLPISARLSVLSACQTALLDMANLPDEVSSMSTALLVAGSTAVVATQWPLGDEAAAILMPRFYEDLIENGVAIGEALRRAQLWLRDSEPTGRFAHPRHWAPFVLAGA